MPSTSPDGISYPDGTDQVAPLAPWFATLATDVQAALTTRFAADKFQDSGWVNVTLNGGYTAFDADSTLQYRKIGKVVYLRGTVSGTIAAAGGGGVAVATLPGAVSPPRFVRSAGATSAGDSRRVNVSTSGVIALNSLGSNAITWQSLDDVQFILN